MLHAFAKRTAPAQFRRASGLRFKRLAAKIDAHYKVSLRTFELPKALRRQRNLARKLSRVAYLSNS